MCRHMSISAYAQTYDHQCTCADTRPSVPMRRHTQSSVHTAHAHAQTQGHQCLCADTHIHQCTLHMHMRRHKAISDHAQAHVHQCACADTCPSEIMRRQMSIRAQAQTHVHQCACADSVRVEDSTIWSSLECQSGGLGSAKDRSGSGDRIGLQIPPKTRGYSL